MLFVPSSVVFYIDTGRNQCGVKSAVLMEQVWNRYID